MKPGSQSLCGQSLGLSFRSCCLCWDWGWTDPCDCVWVSGLCPTDGGDRHTAPDSRVSGGKSSPASSPIRRHVPIGDLISFHCGPFRGEVIGLTLGGKAILKEMSFWICSQCRNLSQIAWLIKEICSSWSNIQLAWVETSVISPLFGQPGKE